MTLFWRTSTATATTCCHHYHEEQTQTDFYLQNSVPKLFFTSWKPKVIFKHIWKLPLSIPIHNVKLLQQPYGIFYSEISSTMNPYNLSLSADLHTTHGSTKPRNLGHRNSWPRHPTSTTMNPQKNSSHNQIKPISKSESKETNKA